MQSAYRHDLAYIHDVGFGHFAASAAPLVIEELKRSAMESGTVVELGCGSGIASRLFRDAGFGVVGIDLSESLIEMARKRVPDAEFRVESFVTAEIPPCVAVTAIGEVFNYAFDPANSYDIRAKVYERIYAALAPGGLLVFDVAGPARAPANGPQRNFFEGPDWAVLVETETDDTRTVLTRRMTSFLKQGELYRRDFEIHQLQLVDPVETARLLERIGFSARTLDHYGALPLPQGLVGFLARKPGGESPQLS